LDILSKTLISARRFQSVLCDKPETEMRGIAAFAISMHRLPWKDWSVTGQ